MHLKVLEEKLNGLKRESQSGVSVKRFGFLVSQPYFTLAHHGINKLLQDKLALHASPLRSMKLYRAYL